MKKKLKLIITLIVLLSLYIFVSAYFYVSQVSNDLQKNVLRLHVIANSDSLEDQNLKYIVRDNLIKYMNSLCSNVSSKEEALDTVSTHLSDFTTIANNTIKENGFSYNASVELGNFEFPTKNYADISFPSGYYDALKVNLGKSKRSKLVVCIVPCTLFC